MEEKMRHATSLMKKFNYSKGSVSNGLGFGVLGIMAIFAMGIMMLGNVTPSKHNKNTQEVIIRNVSPEVSKPVLQLHTFPAVTLTPTPIPTLPPEPHEQGGFNYGDAPGGNSAPGHGGGGGGGSAI